MKNLLLLVVPLLSSSALAAPLIVDSGNLVDYRVTESTSWLSSCNDEYVYKSQTVSAYLKLKSGQEIRLELGVWGGGCDTYGDVGPGTRSAYTLELGRILAASISTEEKGVCTRTIAIVDLEGETMDFDHPVVKCP